MDAKLDRLGSSPPVRGTRARLHCRRPLVRFIPACAGNTASPIRQLRMPPVHPRLCGEHPVEPGERGAGGGSSPPVRGTPHHARPARCVCRFIPACAGNTDGRIRTGASSPVHPRLCGEHARWSPTFSYSNGSSPPVRGTLPRGGYAVDGDRFIPACAGNTATPIYGARSPAVHPRLCGEHQWTDARREHDNGSSPPVRGTLSGRHIERHAHRFIPACAGNTDDVADDQPGEPVHPRLCGEHT